jgi:hypothetical protein
VKQYQISSQAFKDRYIKVSYSPGTNKLYVRQRDRHGMTALGEIIYVFGGRGYLLTNTEGDQTEICYFSSQMMPSGSDL